MSLVSMLVWWNTTSRIIHMIAQVTPLSLPNTNMRMLPVDPPEAITVALTAHKHRTDGPLTAGVGNKLSHGGDAIDDDGARQIVAVTEHTHDASKITVDVGAHMHGTARCAQWR